MPEEARLFEVPKDILFTLKDVTYTPTAPRLKAPFTVKGKVELFKIPFVAPIWVIAKVTYPEKWWEEIIPIIGSPTAAEGDIALGSDFEISFSKGFDREGEFTLEVAAYAGPTFSVDKMTLPPFPPVSTFETTFIVAGEVPPEELGFRNFKIVSYSKNSGTPVTPPGVLKLDIGDRLVIKLGFDHRDLAVTAKIHAAIWKWTLLDPHNEQLNSEKTFTAPASDDWIACEESIDIIITSKIEAGDYGLYAKIMGVTGGDIFTPYYENVITIAGPPGLDFDLTRPTVSQTPVEPGTTIDITCPVKSRCTAPVDATAKVIIYEGSLLPGHGAKIKEYDSGVFRINPEESKDIVVHHPTIAGTIDRRDVEVQIYVGGKLVKQSEWDDVYYVTVPEMELLEVIIDPSGAGSVTTSPAPSSGTTNNWYFPHGAIVNVTAHPNAGYTFKNWSGEMTDTTDITAPVSPMTEKRTITSHFTKTVAPPAADIRNFDFVPTKGTYSMGDKVPFTAPYEYKGKAQSGKLTISLGTGVTPTFSTVYTFSSVSVSFAEAMDWVPKSISGNITLPSTLTPGQTYSVRAKLETLTDPTQETDTNWGVITITEAPELKRLVINRDPVAGGSVTASPVPTSGTVYDGYYPKGTTVKVTAHPSSGYSFKNWSGELTDTTNLTAPVYMTENRTITAHFSLGIPGGEYEIELASEPFAGGYIEDVPDKPLYAYGDIITFTAHPYLAYKFDHWDFNGEWMGTLNPINMMVVKSGRVTAHFFW